MDLSIAPRRGMARMTGDSEPVTVQSQKAPHGGIRKATCLGETEAMECTCLAEPLLV